MGVEALKLEVLGFEVRRTGGEERRAISRSLRGLRCGRICIPFRVSRCSVTYPHSPTSPHAVPNDHDGEIVASKQRSLGSSQFRQVGVQYIQYSLSASSSRLGPSACMLVIHICSLYSLGPGRGADGGGRCVAEQSEVAISTMGQLFNPRLLKIPRR